MRRSGSYGLKLSLLVGHCPMIEEQIGLLSSHLFLNSKVKKLRRESLRRHARVPHLILAPFVIAVLYIFGLRYICCLAYADVGLGAFLEV
jgi:hypothetical protein